MGRSDEAVRPMWSLARTTVSRTIRAMQVIAPRMSTAAHRKALVLGTLVGAILLIGGLAVAYLTFGTPFISRFTPGLRPAPGQVVAGMLAWTFALIAPAAFIMAGAARLAATIDSVSKVRPKSIVAPKAASSLSDEYIVTSRLRLPDGRLVRELVLGPFGVAVIEELPPPTVSRHRNGVWEVRIRGRWMAIESPLDRAARDAERVRKWLSDDESDFLVKVYAAVVAPDTTLPRTPNCAVITSEQIPAWLSSLPPQRSLTEGRRDQLVERIREIR